MERTQYITIYEENVDKKVHSAINPQKQYTIFYLLGGGGGGSRAPPQKKCFPEKKIKSYFKY